MESEREVNMKVKRLMISFGALLIGTIIVALIVRLWLNAYGYDPEKMNPRSANIEVVMVQEGDEL